MNTADIARLTNTMPQRIIREIPAYNILTNSVLDRIVREAAYARVSTLTHTNLQHDKGIVSI
jgi:hypothetical protein